MDGEKSVSKPEARGNPDSIMDWELSEVGEVIAPKIVNEVPADKVGVADFEVESFSFSSDSEEEEDGVDAQADTKLVPVLSTAFDIKVLQTAVESSEETLKLVEGKDVVMVAGKTGVGKSTLIQGIAGKLIHEIDHKTSFSGEVASKTVYAAEDALPGFEIGHNMKSKTSSINGLLRSSGNTEVVYLDTPGVEDTGGVEMDIATASLLSQVAKRCKSLKFVVLIHCASLIEDRGGALRSVVKFARSFVQDFSQSKMSFMFLFTHTDEITGMSDSLDDAKHRLLEEIIRTAEGTNDGDEAMVVLDFIRKCLKKNYPFVQIFHPLEMNYAQLTTSIETKVKKVTDLSLASNCNLTLAAKLKLEGATQSLVQQIQVALRESKQDVQQVRAIQNTLEYLKKYVEVDCVRRAANECKAIVGEHVAGLRASISDNASRGTSSDLEFNQEHINSLKATLLQLEELDDPSSFKHNLEIIKTSLLDIQEVIVVKACRLEPFHAELKKLNIWADGFQDFSPIYTTTCSKITKYMQGLTTAVSAIDIARLDLALSSEVGVLVRNLYVLHALSEQLTEFPTTGINIEDHIHAKESALQQLSEVFKSWAFNGVEFAEASNVDDFEDDLEALAKQVHVLDTIQALLKENCQPFPILEKDVISTKKNVQREVFGRFELYCAEILGKAFDPSCKPLLCWMKAVSDRFSMWKEVQSSFCSVMDKVKSALYKASGELENMAHMVQTHGMMSGENLARDLVALENCQWFDMFVPSDQKFVAQCCDRVKSVIDSRVEKKHSERSSICMKLSAHGSSSATLIKDIGTMLPELREIEKYANNVRSDVERILLEKECESDLAVCNAHLESHVTELSKLSRKCMDLWNTNANRGRLGYMRSMTRKLNYILADCEALSTVGASDIVSQMSHKIKSFLHDEFLKFKNVVRAEFSSFGGNFDIQAAFLVTMKACSGFSHVESQLPTKNAIRFVRDMVSKEAATIETSIGASSDWDSIDKSIVNFEAATVLDPFVSGEVSTRLRTLKRLREQKEDQVDDLMQDMIVNCNFKGIGDFLTPIAHSKDQVKKQKFKQSQDEISSSLEEIMNGAHRLLNAESDVAANSKSIAEKMDVLVDAKSELQSLLAAKLNLAYEIPKLKRQSNAVLRQFTKQVSEAVSEKDFVQMIVVRRQASIFLTNMRNHLTAHDISLYEKAREKSKSEIELVSQYVEKFFKSRFENGDDLFKAMSSLKHANDMGSFSNLAELYEATKKSIASKVHDTVKLVETVASESQCFDDMINYVHSLHRQLQGPLREHCSNNMVSDCERLTEDLRQQKAANDRDIEFGGQDYKHVIERVSIRLDRLSSTRRWSWMWSHDNATYVRIQRILLEKVEGRFDQAQVALKSRDFKTVQECIDFLEVVHRKAERHVKIVGVRVRDIHDRCITAFIKLCDDAKQILNSENSVQFKESFPDYRGFVIHISCVLRSPSCQKSFALVNQLLYAVLEDSISVVKQLAEAEAFDASRLRSQVLQTRVWGAFLADQLTLLHEEIGLHTNAKPDAWLANIHKLCWEYFNVGRDLSNIKFCAILGVTPSASQSDIKEAFKEKALRYHPDKNREGDDTSDMFRKARDAHEKLLAMSHLVMSIDAQPLDEILIGVGEKIRDHAKTFMINQQYDAAEKLLFELPNLKVLDDLVTPMLNSSETCSAIHLIIKGYIEKTRVDVESNWSARNYQDLNNTITDLKKMEKHFKAYPEIFPKSWDTGICNDIELEIETLGKKASGCLKSRVDAKQKQGDFRRCFIQMGSVLIELPAFKHFTKNVMSCVLEKCLDSDWGYSYLFELGLSLQKGDESSSDSENQIAQMIVSEFSHFKEVLTMVWNEEVSQKPAEDVVMHITGELQISPTQTNPIDIDRKMLLDSFANYERQYKSLLGDYLKPDADLHVLVHKTVSLASQVMPEDGGNEWKEELKKEIPTLLAGVFALFTVLKSGASYNRIEAAAGSSTLGEKLLMKPHNIQVLTLLFMFGCGKSNKDLESQLMQIRTGEGKSIILGAAAVMLALLGFKVRTVCYSEYLSNRDYELFKEVFDRFGLTEYIKYSKITSFAEDSTANKGDIRHLTESLLRGTLLPSQTNANNALNQDVATKNSVNSKPELLGGSAHSTTTAVDSSGSSSRDNIKPIGSTAQSKKRSPSTLSQQPDKTDAIALKKDKPDAVPVNGRKEILLVDEVDVFFGKEFYGTTYNQVVEFREPEIEEILKRIWNAWVQGGRRLKLSDIKAMPEYSRLLYKLPSFSFLLDNEISLMLDQVSKVDDVPYYLDVDNGRIGYKVMDTISYDATYGYATCFAYLKEHQKFKNKGTLAKVLMLVSCGQFSYANISPHRILGVSGTLNALSENEKDILLKYGLDKFVYVPSVYGSSNFDFDKADRGIYFENNKSDFFHRISAEITASTKAKRAVIVFFRDRAELREFVASPTYRQLNRHKKTLTEDMTSTEKGFVITKAATAGQITLSTAVFGRGTDFFCKDDVVESTGGVHVIQTFLSDELSEEIQIQGRTARQGKRGSYQLVLLESDLESHFGVTAGEKDKIPKKDVYDWLCDVRRIKQNKQSKLMEDNLLNATEKDTATHKYFDRLLACDAVEARKEFESLYHLMKKPPMPSSLVLDLAFAIDVTGSMAPYSNCMMSTCESLISGQSSILVKLKSTFPEIDFKLRVAILGFRDIDDKQNQFKDSVWSGGGHFTDNVSDVLRCLKSMTSSTFSGGADIAEDHIGAIHHCSNGWNHSTDWTSSIKCLMLLSDAPSHGFSVSSLSTATNYDSYPTRHPAGLSLSDAISSLLLKDIDLFFCSFNPIATARTEEVFLQGMKAHPDNKSERGITCIPMVPKDQIQAKGSGSSSHIIFVLDESSSMNNSWGGVVAAYQQYIEKRKQSQNDLDLVSVVQFDNRSRVTVKKKSLHTSPKRLSQRRGGTVFHPAALDACKVARDTPSSHIPTIIFMSDGGTGSSDAASAAREFSLLNDHVSQQSENDLELHVIAFGAGANQLQLQQIAGASPAGKVHASANTADLASVFVSIASNQNIATLLESEIAKRMSAAVSDKLSLEYFGS